MNVNRDILVGNWKEYKGRVKQYWGKFTDDDLQRMSGRKDEIVGKLQQRYGYSKERAEEEYTKFMSKISEKVKA